MQLTALCLLVFQPPAEVETVFGISRVFLLAIGVAFILVLFTVVISNPQSVVG